MVSFPRVWTRSVTTLALAMLVACGSTEPTDVRGTYQLQAVNGQAVPSGGVTSGFVTLTPAGEWSWAMSLASGPMLVTGTWSGSGSTLTLLSYQPPTVITATIAGDVLTFSQGGTAYRFQR